MADRDDNVVQMFTPYEELVSLSKQHPLNPEETKPAVKFLCVTRSSNILISSGLLWKINKDILHPLGMALCVATDEEGDSPPTIHLIKTKTGEPMEFCYKANEEGEAKYNYNRFITTRE